MTSKYRILLSDSIARDSLKCILGALRDKYAHLTLESWIADQLDCIELVSCKLRPLTAFSKVVRAIWIRSFALGTACDAQFEEFCRLCDRNRFAGTSMMWRTLQTMGTPTRDGVLWRSDLSFAAGLAQDGYWTKVSLSSDSHLWNDTVQRREVFREAIRLWGLADRLRIEPRGSDFVIMADPPVKLRYLFNREGNLNPTDFRVSGHSSLEQAIGAARASRDGLSAQVLEATFGCSVSREQYDEIYHHFNALHRGWHTEVQGTISREAEAVLNGRELCDSSPTWIPAFRWWEEGICAKVYGSVIIENGERYLEVATDGGSLEMLQERVAFLDEVHFTPVFP